MHPELSLCRLSSSGSVQPPGHLNSTVLGGAGLFGCNKRLICGLWSVDKLCGGLGGLLLGFFACSRFCRMRPFACFWFGWGLRWGLASSGPEAAGCAGGGWRCLLAGHAGGAPLRLLRLFLLGLDRRKLRLRGLGGPARGSMGGRLGWRRQPAFFALQFNIHRHTHLQAHQSNCWFRQHCRFAMILACCHNIFYVIQSLLSQTSKNNVLGFCEAPGAEVTHCFWVTVQNCPCSHWLVLQGRVEGEQGQHGMQPRGQLLSHNEVGDL